MNLKKIVSTYRMFIISMLIAMIISLDQFIEGVILWNNPAYGIPENLYISWIGGTLFFKQTHMFYMAVPILAAASVGIDYGKLRKGGYFNQLKIRMGMNKFSRVIGGKCYLIGFSIAAIPLLANLLLTMTLRPLLYPDPLVAIGPYFTEVGVNLFYSHPMIYTLLFILFDGNFAGLISLFTLVLCNVMENYYLATIIPYVLFYVLSTIGNIFSIDELSLSQFLVPGIGMNSYTCIIEMVIAEIIIMMFWIYQGRKDSL